MHILLHFAKQERGCGILNVSLIQLGSLGADPLYVAPTRKQLVTNSDMPQEYVGEWEVVPPGGSAHILQNDRLSVQHVACYIHNTEAVERS